MAVLPMFPLGSVLFPTLVLPLHVFEPRYRRLVGDCLAGDGEFGVVLIERGSEVGGGDARSAVGTVARIVEHVELQDGQLGLITAGTWRLRVNCWLPDDPYPLADVDPWPDPDADGGGLDELAAATVGALRRVLALAAEAGLDVPASTIELADDPAVVSYQVGALAPFGPFDRHRLLAAPCVRDRFALAGALLTDARALLELELGQQAGPDDVG